MDIEALKHQAALYDAPSDAMVCRALDEIDEALLRRIVVARRDAQGWAWSLPVPRNPRGSRR